MQSGCPWRANYSLGDPCTVSSMPQVNYFEIHGHCNPYCWSVHSWQEDVANLTGWIFFSLLLPAVRTQLEWRAYWTCLSSFFLNPPFTSHWLLTQTQMLADYHLADAALLVICRWKCMGSMGCCLPSLMPARMFLPTTFLNHGVIRTGASFLHLDN